MDPLGARCHFVDVQTLPTWPQQLEEEGQATSPGQSDGQDVPSPFPFRPDINSKIILLWVPRSAPHATAAAGCRGARPGSLCVTPGGVWGGWGWFVFREIAISLPSVFNSGVEF